VSAEPEQGGAVGESGGRASAITAEAERQLEEQRDKYLRLAAEFDNYRKRMARERQELTARAQGELVKRLLDSLDDFGRVIAVDASTASAQSIIDGVDVVQKKLMRSLSAAGLEVVDPIDQPFNPELHEAVATERALSPEDDHLVAQVYQPGYVFQGQLLRPARVVVKQWTE
jgi:molecular chaperone GrpE